MGSKSYACDKCKNDLTAEEMTKQLAPNDSEDYPRPCCWARATVPLPDGTATKVNAMLCIGCSIEIAKLLGYSGPTATPQAAE